MLNQETMRNDASIIVNKSAQTLHTEIYLRISWWSLCTWILVLSLSGFHCVHRPAGFMSVIGDVNKCSQTNKQSNEQRLIHIVTMESSC